MTRASSSGGRSTHCHGGFLGRPPCFAAWPKIFAPRNIIVRSLVLAALAFIFSASTESGGGSNGATSANTVTVSGMVGGTRIVVMNDNDQVVIEDDTAGRPPSAPGRFPFTLTSPTAGALVTVGPGTVTFVVQNYTIGNPGTSHPQFYLDTDATAIFKVVPQSASPLCFPGPPQLVENTLQSPPLSVVE